MSKIIGYTVGTTIPKPNFAQNDPKKGDFIKGRELLDAKYLNVEAQELTEAQKSQVRINIGAPSAEYVINVFEELKTLIQAGNAGGAIAVLDAAILDLAELA